MKIRDIMTPEPRACTPETTLAAAAGLMWDTDCGILPVVDVGSNLVGVISMNDLVLAAGPAAPVRSENVVDTLKAICAHHLPAPHAVA